MITQQLLLERRKEVTTTWTGIASSFSSRLSLQSSSSSLTLVFFFSFGVAVAYWCSCKSSRRLFLLEQSYCISLLSALTSLLYLICTVPVCTVFSWHFHFFKLMFIVRSSSLDHFHKGLKFGRDWKEHGPVIVSLVSILSQFPHFHTKNKEPRRTFFKCGFAGLYLLQ